MIIFHKNPNQTYYNLNNNNNNLESSQLKFLEPVKDSFDNSRKSYRKKSKLTTQNKLFLKSIGLKLKNN